jgi:hypothetical protein
MKIVGGILVALGFFYLLSSAATYYATGQFHGPYGWANFGGIFAVGIVVIAIGIKLFLGKPPGNGGSENPK